MGSGRSGRSETMNGKSRRFRIAPANPQQPYGSMRKTAIITVCSVLLACISTGCMTVNPDTLNKNVRAWVPIGTSVEDAIRSMGEHGFDCHVENHSPLNPTHGPVIVCSRENRFYNRLWLVTLFVQNGKVVGNDPSRIMGGLLKPRSGAHF